MEGLEATCDKFRFELFGFVGMPNHVHLFFRTPEPNLSRGMQCLLSGSRGPQPKLNSWCLGPS